MKSETSKVSCQTKVLFIHATVISVHISDSPGLQESLQWLAKAQIRLHKCAVWSEPLTATHLKKDSFRNETEKLSAEILANFLC